MDLITTEKPRWKEIRQKIDQPSPIFEREIVIPPYRRLPTIYSTFAYWLCRDAVLTPFLRRNYDLTVTTAETLPVVFSDILYIHSPISIIPHLKLGVYYREYSAVMMRAYASPYTLLTGLFTKWFKTLAQKPILVTNSKYTRQMIREYLETDALIVYPPVDIEKYIAVNEVSEKENNVLTISRLEGIKNLAFIPELAQKTRNCKFIILGLTGATSRQYVSRLLREAKTLGVEDRIEIVQNASETTKKEILSRSKIYLHTRLNEPFGISIAEAMAAGLVPVVHQSGGPWLDILDERQGTYGYFYTSTDEAANIINELLDKEQERLQVSARAIERSKLFDSKRFMNCMVRLVRDRLNT